MSYIEDNNTEEYVNSVINNLKKILGVTSDRQLSIRLDIKPPSFANTIKRGLLPYEKIVLFAKKHNQSLDKIFLLQNQNYTIENEPKCNYSELESNSISSNNSTEIQLINGEQTIKIPNLPVTPNKTLRAFIDDKKIYIIDTKDKIFVNNNYYLLKSSNAFFPMIVSMDLDGQYILKNDDDITTKLTLDEFNKIEIVGKVNFKLTRETFI